MEKLDTAGRDREGRPQERTGDRNYKSSPYPRGVLKDQSKSPRRSSNSRSPFRAMCYNCGVRGDHTTSKCPKPMKCFECDKIGHPRTKCPNKDTSKKLSFDEAPKGQQ